MTWSHSLPVWAEVGVCAQEQGSLWKYHDRLFAASPRKLDVPDLKACAADVGLDTDQLNACLDGGGCEGEVAKDVQEGIDAQASATQTFFCVNGWQAAGAQPVEVFEKHIERSLSGR